MSEKPTYEELERRIEDLEKSVCERKRAETYRDLSRDILQILNEPGDLHASIQRVLAALKTRTGVDAAGLRLQEGEDFPYFVQDGFPPDFLLTENTLIERGGDGGVCRDKDGNVRLECTCGLVISGKTDPSNPLFTRGGSCWTNDSFPLLDLPSDQDPRLHPRNNCIHHGYASVALIPLWVQDRMHSRGTCIRHGFRSLAHAPVRTGDRIVGLIQLNDKRKGRFTLETIEFLEDIAAHVGSALMRKQAEETIRQALKEKTLLLSEIHHRVKNNLQTVSSLINLQINETGDEKTACCLQETQSRIQAMAAIHENLHASEVMTEINMETHLQHIMNSIYQIYGRYAPDVRATVSGEGVRLSLDQAVPTGLIVNELLTNAYKYAFPDRREDHEIQVTMHDASSSGLVRLIVGDNGVGIPESMDWKNASTLGLRLAVLLAEQQLGGTIELDRHRGARFTITFARDDSNE